MSTTTISTRKIRRFMARTPASGQKGRQRRRVSPTNLKLVLRKRTDATRMRAAQDFVDGILAKPSPEPQDIASAGGKDPTRARRQPASQR